MTDADWRGRADRLAAGLADHGDLTDPAWRAAIAATPRHALVPSALRQGPDGAWERIDTATAEGLDLVYSPQTLVTDVDSRGHAVSSSTKPDLMVRMLETLEVRDGMRVLEIGTGTGYNSALLAHRLGDDNTFSVDVDPELVETARARLAGFGRRPMLVAADGAAGLPDHAPYDRIIATCSVPAVPWAWAEQVPVGGRVLADLKITTGAGNLVSLTRLPDRLEGRFTPRWAGFMAMRHTTTPLAPPVIERAAEAVERTTTAPPNPWHTHLPVWLLAALRLPGGVAFGAVLDRATRRPSAATLTAADGSWAQVDLDPPHGERRLVQAGPTPLWDQVEAAHADWRALGEPDWPRLGLTVTADRQWVWCDDPGGPHTWPV